MSEIADRKRSSKSKNDATKNSESHVISIQDNKTKVVSPKYLE